jgi:hypothetical protein
MKTVRPTKKGAPKSKKSVAGLVPLSLPRSLKTALFVLNNVVASKIFSDVTPDPTPFPEIAILESVAVVPGLTQ